MAFNLFLGEIEITTAWTVAVNGGGAVPLTAGSYYVRSTVAAESFIAHLQTLITAVQACTVTFDNATGRISIRNDGGVNLQIDVSAPLQAQLGWSAASQTIAPAATFVGDYQARRAWLPNVEPSELTGYLGSRGRRLDDVQVGISGSGAYKRTTGSYRYEQGLTFKALASERVWDAAELLGNESLEQFWIDALNPGLRVRWFLDRTSASYVQSIEFRCATERLEPTPTIASSHRWWNVVLLLVPANET